MEQIKAEIAAVLQAVARGDKRYRYLSPFMNELVRWDVVTEDLYAILERHVAPAEIGQQVVAGDAAAKV